MYYSLDFAAQVVRLCMDEIRQRGLQERKILRKSVPNSVLCIKVFKRHCCLAADLTCVDIHSVATLMQDVLVCCQERIMPKKSWRIINYETCTLSELSQLLTEKGEQLLITILDFLVEMMQYKEKNEMNAYRLGEAMGKVTLGPTECSAVMAEKASHFLTRMVIEHSKLIHSAHSNKNGLLRVDSGFERESYSSYYCEHLPMSKREASRAKAKYYSRLIRKTQTTGTDWASNALGVQAMLDNDYDYRLDPPEKPWISIFSSMEDLSVHREGVSQPILYRILMEANKPVLPVPSNPFATSYLFSPTQIYSVENQLEEAFKDFVALCSRNAISPHWVNEKTTSPLAKLNHSISNLKLNIRKIRSRHDILEENDGEESAAREEISYMTTGDPEIRYSETGQRVTKPKNMKNMMRKVMKMGGNMVKKDEPDRCIA